MKKQLNLFEEESPKVIKQELDFLTKTIDPKNPNTVGKSIANLGNHVLLTGFIGAIIFVVYASY
tara:strand:+ start:40171 stop:40362 length:192 start_codon:yes stop_codon:yes gene_type:complete